MNGYDFMQKVMKFIRSFYARINLININTRTNVLLFLINEKPSEWN